MEQKYEAEKIEVQKRFDALPENLKKEMLADKNVRLISTLCQEYGLPEDKVKNIALLVGEVFLGYIKPAEIASELNIFFGIDRQKSNFIEIELKQKLFNPLKADLEKIYNPPKLEMPAEKKEEEPAPAIIKIEPFDRARGKQEAAAITAALPKTPAAPSAEKKSEPQIPPLTISSIPAQPQKTETAAIEKKEPPMAKAPFGQAQDKPFIIQTKVESVKQTTPQFLKEIPSLNLKVDSSFIQKPPTVKPISIRLETEQQPDTVKFKMPVLANKKPIPEKLAPILPKISVEQKPTTVQLQPTEIKIPIQQKTVAVQPIIATKPAIEQKPIIESKIVPEQSFKIVHYSNFKTPLAPSGIPKKPESKKEDMINLATFTKISGNTVDLRKPNK